jgi:hypothetical protein
MSLIFVNLVISDWLLYCFRYFFFPEVLPVVYLQSVPDGGSAVEHALSSQDGRICRMVKYVGW